MMSRSLDWVQQKFSGQFSAAVGQANSDSADSAEFHGFDTGQGKLGMQLAPAASGHEVLSVPEVAA
jgi:hypothetical protein